MFLAKPVLTRLTVSHVLRDTISNQLTKTWLYAQAAQQVVLGALQILFAHLVLQVIYLTQVFFNQLRNHAL